MTMNIKHMRTGSALIVAISCILFYSMVSPYTSASDLKSWIVLRNKEYKFRFIHPPNWKSYPIRGERIRAKVLDPSGISMCTVSVDAFPDTASLSQEDINRLLNSDTMSVQMWKQELSSLMSEVVIHNSFVSKVHNIPAYFAEYQGSYETLKGKVYLKGIQFITATPGLRYSFGCASTSYGDVALLPQVYERWKPVFIDIISSFYFEK